MYQDFQNYHDIIIVHKPLISSLPTIIIIIKKYKCIYYNIFIYKYTVILHNAYSFINIKLFLKISFFSIYLSY